MNITGLSEKEAKKRLEAYGKNEIRVIKRKNPFKLFISQFSSPIILLLIFASLLSFFINFFRHEGFLDSVLILSIVFLSGIAGFIQDYKAERTIEALQKMVTPYAKVIREGKEKLIKASEIVPCDIVVLEAGDIVPADVKIIQGFLEVNESILTGESRAVKKERGNMVFSGCAIYNGKAIAKVISTGMETKIGKIAEKMQKIEEIPTPFQSHMKDFTRKIVNLTIIIIILTFIVAYKKFGFIQAVLISVSLAVASIPENLPAVITIGLSLGSREMAKKNALMRKLSVAESIGSVDVICTDKTGTITEGVMKVRRLWFLKTKDRDVLEKLRELAIKCCYYCNNAKVLLNRKRKIWVGDETDIALKEYSSKYIDGEEEIKEEISFTSERKMMSVVVNDFIFSKGAPEVILKKCNRVFLGNVKKLSRKLEEEILNKNKFFASKGYRVLALAYKPYSIPIERNLIFIGLIVISDPPRKEVKKAVRECYSAGIRVIMVTGDNPLTAKAVADEVGIKTRGIIIGDELDSMSNEELEKKIESGVNIFARTNPFHKLRILEILQKKHIVAMTGDGVNDALALKKADVGIAMGRKGTEVAKEASDIILLDDNFASIRNAVKEGRRIFDNTRKFVDYLLTCNVAEVLVVLFTILLFPFISLFPIQILWINLITDGLPALALSVDPARPDVMRRKPRKINEGIINKKLAFLIGGIGFKKSLIVLGTFLVTLALTNNRDLARSTLFTGFIMYEFVRIGVIRYNEKLRNLKDWFANKFLVYALILSLILQLIILYTPLSKYFKIVPLGIVEWFILICGVVVGFIFGIGISKFIDSLIKEEY